MPSSDHSDHGTTFKGTNKDNKDKFSLQSATDVAVDPPQKHSRSLSVESTVNRAVKPAVEATLNEADYYASSPPAKRLKYDSIFTERAFFTYADRPSRFHDNNAITVYVGPEKAAFTIHRGPICEASAYFKALFDGTFKETSEKVVTLLEHTPETFDQFLGFAYAKNLDRTTFQALDEEARWMAYSKLYVLADYLDSQTLKATVVGILFARIGSARVLKKSACITAQVIGYIYENTLRNCGLRKLIVAQQ
jgi:hypothetical protein